MANFSLQWVSINEQLLSGTTLSRQFQAQKIVVLSIQESLAAKMIPKPKLIYIFICSGSYVFSAGT